MENKINNTKLSFTCNQDWSLMKNEDANGRFCATCQKKVYDLTDKNTAYFLQILQENNNSVCGRFTKEQMATANPVHQPYWKKPAFAAIVFIGLGTFTKEANAQNALGKTVPPKTTLPEQEPGILMGEVVVVTFSPEIQSLHAYLAKHCSVPDNTNGSISVSFQLQKDGTMTKLVEGEQVSETVRLEIIRVLNKAVRKGKFKLKPYQNYPTIFPLNFINGKIQPYIVKH